MSATRVTMSVVSNWEADPDSARHRRSRCCCNAQHIVPWGSIQSFLSKGRYLAAGGVILRRKRHHEHGKREANCYCQIGVGERLNLCFPVGEKPKLFERRGLCAWRIAPSLGVPSRKSMQHIHHRCIRRIEMFGNAQGFKSSSPLADGVVIRCHLVELLRHLG